VPVDDFLANLAVCSLIASPVKDTAGNRAMYAGTGEGFSNLDAIRGAGIFWSPDGNRWSQLPSANTDDFKAVNRLAISCDGKSMLAATPTGIHRSDTPALLAWLPVLNAGAGDVRFHPTNPALAVAGALSSGEAYYSIDGGRNWTVRRPIQTLCTLPST
jgi:hypothetical protein